MSARLAWIPFTCLETVEPDTHKAYMEILKVHQNASVDKGMVQSALGIMSHKELLGNLLFGMLNYHIVNKKILNVA